MRFSSTLCLPATPIKNIYTESGRGISGNLDTVNGELSIGSIPWLKENKTQLSDDVQNFLASSETNLHTTVGVSLDKKLLGVILIGDQLRDDTKSSLEKLKNENIAIHIFSGDRRETVLDIGSKLNLKKDNLAWELLPEEKLAKIESLKKYSNVAMVGDGINDAAALATADVGIGYIK